ncbi:MAG: WYL domain-containing protein [Verrucomicrobiota bacterium]
MPYRRVDHGFVERMLRIHEELQRGASTNCTKLATSLEVSRKTIVRDIAYMRDRLELPIEFDAKKNTYRYTEHVSSFPTVKVSEGEVFALMVARKALEQYRGTAFHRQLSASFDKLSAGLQDTVSFSHSDELQSVSFKSVGMGRSDAEVFNHLSRAVHHHLEIEFDYRKPGDLNTALRRVRPYHLANRDNLWYLVAFDIARGALRTFAVPRITHVTVSDTTFTRPADFSPEKFFANALGVLGGDRDYRVVIRFTPAVADRVREREWHESQKLREISDGGLELTLQLGALPEIERWVLRWGADAQVLQPKVLRERLKQIVAALSQIYR